ncbi:MAG: M15 family metallopeptidase [Bacteroidales bacterium]|nr:M15 family metallopeptidase [Bacteroidales bacterium]
MKKSFYILILISILALSVLFILKRQNESTTIIYGSPQIKADNNFNPIDSNLIKLQKSYPDFIIGIKNNTIIWKDSSTMIFDDSLEKDFDELLNNPDVQDMFTFKYTPFIVDTPCVNFDPGRIRNDEFFKKMYGFSKNEVRANLDTIIWLPSTLNMEVLITKVNGVNIQLQAISNELDSLIMYHKYVETIGGTFNWRKILNTNRLSAHSFGIAIDINVKYSNYWEWDKSYSSTIKYKNQIPIEIVRIFEKHGFIWGGRWYHYDTMHFEYRPELL